MRDRFSEQRIALCHPLARPIFTKFINEVEDTLNITLRITMSLRTTEEQNALYAQGRTTPGKIVTNAKGGTSYHNFGLAIDLAEMINNDTQVDWTYDMSKLKPIAEKYNIEWGGDWVHIKDRPHFELRFGYKEDCSDLVQLEKDKQGYLCITQQA